MQWCYKHVLNCQKKKKKCSSANSSCMYTWVYRYIGGLHHHHRYQHHARIISDAIGSEGADSEGASCGSSSTKPLSMEP